MLAWVVPEEGDMIPIGVPHRISYNAVPMFSLRAEWGWHVDRAVTAEMVVLSRGDKTKTLFFPRVSLANGDTFNFTYYLKEHD